MSFRPSGKFIAVVVLLSIGVFASLARADHAWGGYHWASTANPFTLKLGDNVTTAWDSYLNTTSTDWTVSSVLDTNVVPGKSSPRTCKAVQGRIEVCNSKYGKNGWLGIASVWANGSHIVQGTVKLNDTYFNTAKYNTPAWKNLVMCQEVGHTFGLDHQDEVFDNPNLGTCMDYTSDPSGALLSQLDNQHPNAHDYEELELIYGHPDTFNSMLFTTPSSAKVGNAADIDTSNPTEWGKAVRRSADGRNSLYRRDLGNGNQVFTFVVWAN